MTEIVDFDSFLEIARNSDEPQRLLFVFLKTALPEDATEAERERYEQGRGGGLVPVMYVDKSPAEVESFGALKEESCEMGESWDIMLAAALVGRYEEPSSADAENAFARIIQAVHAGGDVSHLLAFDIDGDPLVLEGP